MRGAVARNVTGVLETYGDAFGRGFKPDPRLTVDEWADQYRILSAASSSEPGRYRSSRTPFMRKPMRCLSAREVRIRRVVVMAGAQIAKSESGNNWIGYVIHHVPGPMLVVLPTVEVAKRFSQQRIAPMIEDTPVLSERVSEARSRDHSNTASLKEFEGGVLIITGANSAAGLRSMPIRFLFMDEIDEYPADVDGQGDPIALAEKRTATFVRKKTFLTSTPTIRGLSRIEREYLLSDRQRYYIPCPECEHMDFLTWNGQDNITKIEGTHHRIEWDEGLPATSHMICSGCSAKVPERYKTQMFARGEWRSTRPDADGTTAGFHISSLYSPLGWKSWSDCVSEFLSSKDNPFHLKTWVNTTLGETWEEMGEALETDVILSRARTYEAEVPHGVGILIGSVDVQGDRLEAKIKGYGRGEESWLIAYAQLYGDPGQPKVWGDLDNFLFQPFTHASGQKVAVSSIGVDTGGRHTEQSYRYCKLREDRYVFALKGSSVAAQPVVSRPNAVFQFKLPLYMVGTDTAKDIIYSRLRLTGPGPGYLNFPSWIDREYVDQLTAEKAITRYDKKKGAVRSYEVIGNRRNEAIDLEVYALAALYILGPPVLKALESLATKLSLPPAAEGAPPQRAPRPRSSWASRY